MLGEAIDPSVVPRPLVEKLFSEVERRAKRGALCRVGITGESGSGKSHLAVAFARLAEERGQRAVVVQMDDYFRLPPKRNAARRQMDLSVVGPTEVDLARLDRDLSTLASGETVFEKPLVDYQTDAMTTERLDVSTARYVIVEGTYVALLEQLDVSIFIVRTYEHTRDARLARNREAQTALIERVLLREHAIVRELVGKADLIVTREGELSAQGSTGL